MHVYDLLIHQSVYFKNNNNIYGWKRKETLTKEEKDEDWSLEAASKNSVTDGQSKSKNCNSIPVPMY